MPKRLPPSPIIAPPPPVNEEEPAADAEEAVDEPPAKVARLEPRRLEFLGDEGAAVAIKDEAVEDVAVEEATAAAAAVAQVVAPRPAVAAEEALPLPAHHEGVGAAAPAMKAEEESPQAEAAEGVVPLPGRAEEATATVPLEAKVVQHATDGGTAGPPPMQPPPPDEPPALPPLFPHATNPPAEPKHADGAAGDVQWARGNVADTKMEDSHEEAAKVIDMAVMNAMDVVARTSEGDHAAAVAVPVAAAEEDGAALPAERRVADDSTNQASSAAINEKVDVILDAIGPDGGIPIKTAAGETTAPAAFPDDAAVATTLEEEPKQPAKKAKKERREFTAAMKLRILSELGGPNPPSAAAVRQKYGVSKSSLHRWRQPEKVERLEMMARGAALMPVVGPGAAVRGGGETGGSGGGGVADGEGTTDRSKKRDMNDKLRKIKLGLQAFCRENQARPEDERLAVTSSLIQLKAREIKNELMERHQKEPGVLTDEEAAALKAFKGSKSWACLIGNQLGFLSAAAGSIQWTEAAKNNTALYLDRNARAPRRPKKQRMEFTAQEKLAILRELEDTNARAKSDGVPLLTVEQICVKYQTSKSSLHRWKQQYKRGRLQELAEAGSGYSHSKRVFNDKLHVIKRALNEFYAENEGKPPGERSIVNYATLQARAIVAKEELLERHHAARWRERRRGGHGEEVGRASLEGGAGAGAAPAQSVEDGGGAVAARQGRAGEGIVAHQGVAGEGDVPAQQGEARESGCAKNGEAGEDAVPAQQDEAGEGAVIAQQGEAGEGAVPSQQVEVNESAVAQLGEADEGVTAAQQVEDGKGTITQESGAIASNGQEEGGDCVVDGGKAVGLQLVDNASGGESSSNDIMSKHEVHALENFKASNSWLRETARKFGWKLDADAKRDGGGGMGSFTSAPLVAVPTGGALYHPQEHHPLMEEPSAMEHPGVEQCHAERGHPGIHETRDHPDLGLHGVAHDHPGVGNHDVPQHDPNAGHHDTAQDVADAENHHMAAQQEVEQVFASVVQERLHESNEHQHHQEQGQPVDHLAPNIAAYNAQGNVMAAMLEDPLVNVEDHDVGEIAGHGGSGVINV